MPGDVQSSPPPDPVFVSVVIPVYRNADTVETLQQRIAAALEPAALPFESIFVDDACPAGSGQVLKRLSERDSRVRLLGHETNRGQHRAVLTGLAAARGDWAVILDADLQDPPEAIPALLAKGQQGFGAVFAGRRGRYESPGRLLTSRVFKRILSVLSGVPPDAGIFVALSRPVVKHLLATARGRSSVVGLVGLSGQPLTSVPVERQPRRSGSSAYSSCGRLRSGVAAIFWLLYCKVRTGTRAGSEPDTPS